MMKKTAFSLLIATVSAPMFAQQGPSISGWVDLYYMYDFNKTAAGTALNGRAFDVVNNSFALSNALFSFKFAPTDKTPFGATFDLSFGRNADINAGFDVANGDSLKHLQQAFGTYAGKDGSTLDFGKFNSWIGYEALYPGDNANYSIGTLFNYAQPNYHMGVRYTKPLSETSTLGLYAVNGWNEVQDTNGGKTLGLSYAKTWSPKLSTTVNYIGGNEGTNGIGLPGPGQANVQLLDFVGVYKISDKHTFAVNADYGSAKSLDAGTPGGTFAGWSFYSNHKVDDNRDFSLRYSLFHDFQGVRILTPAAAFTPGTVGSLTLTYNTKTSEKSTLRFELRNDFANANLFQSDSGNKDKRTTFAISHIIRF